ncbi:MAG: toll/interleukin-1 receptor domain-containing protein [Roseburia sp.]|nr:toll/interleukin-1 receptor domain-containing protein [Roseburia sp.]
MPFTRVSKEAEDVLMEILEHEHEGDYWKIRFDKLSDRDDIVLRGCFKELRESGLINVEYADNYPYWITILKDGYLYEKHLEEEKKAEMTPFERELNELLKRAKKIKAPINMAPSNMSRDEYNKPSEIWMNDVQIFYDNYLKEHALGDRIHTLLFHRGLSAYGELVAALTSVSKDRKFIDKMNGIQEVPVPKYQARIIPEYDLFVSHASKDKEELVENLYRSLDKLGIKIFYDKESIEWGDNWKEKILHGVNKAEFAIIVISENFFGREWTERELNELLSRQNRNGQKIILPILKNITIEQLQQKYPSVADIQAIDSKDYSTDDITILFAKQLIKRLKMV